MTIFQLPAMWLFSRVCLASIRQYSNCSSNLRSKPVSLLNEIRSLYRNGLLDPKMLHMAVLSSHDEAISQQECSDLHTIFSTLPIYSKQKNVWPAKIMTIAKASQSLPKFCQSLAVFVLRSKHDSLHNLANLSHALRYLPHNQPEFQLALEKLQQRLAAAQDDATLTSGTCSSSALEIVETLYMTPLWPRVYDLLKYLETEEQLQATFTRMAIAARKFDSNPTVMLEVLQHTRELRLVPGELWHRFMLHRCTLCHNEESEAQASQNEDPKYREKRMSEYLLLLREYDWLLPIEVMPLVEEAFAKFSSQWHLQSVPHVENGICGHCHAQLEVFQVSPEEWIEVKRVLMNLPSASSLPDVSRMLPTFSKHCRCCVVHENYLISRSVPMQPSPNLSNSRLTKRRMKIFQRLSAELSNKHGIEEVIVLQDKEGLQSDAQLESEMQEWARGNSLSLHHVPVAMSGDPNQEDWAVIQAALHLGSECFFFTRNSMMLTQLQGDNCTPENRDLIGRWFHARHLRTNVNLKRTILKHLLPVCVRVQGNMEQGWHLPFLDIHKEDVVGVRPNISWLCVYPK